MTSYSAFKNIKLRRTPAVKDWVCRRGDIYLADLGSYFGSEQGGIRPVVVLQNNTGNFYCPTVIIAPITSYKDKRPDLPVHCFVPDAHGLNVPSIVLLEQLKVIDKWRICKYLGRMNRHQMNRIGETLKVSLGLCVPEKSEILQTSASSPKI